MKKTSAALILAASVFTFIPASVRANSGDFSGGVAIGTSYAGVDAAPTNGLIVQGDVGIGTATPGSGLQVATAPVASSTSSVMMVGNTFTSGVGSSSGTMLAVNAPSGFSGNLIDIRSNNSNSFFRLDGSTDQTTLYYLNVTTGLQTPTITGYGGGDLTIGSGAGTKVLIQSTGGNVGIGNTSPATLLHVGSSSASGIVMELQNSSGACTHSPGATSETVACSSDIRFKSNIKDSTLDALAWMKDMRIRDFTVKSTGEQKTGIVAQEVLLKHPDTVHKDAKGFYLVDEPNPWVLVKALQEQQDEIDELKRTIEQLKHSK